MIISCNGDNGLMQLSQIKLYFSSSPKVVGIFAAVVTVFIWTSFILLARASADESRGGVLNPFDLAFCRIFGSAIILLPLGRLMVLRDRAKGEKNSCLFGFSPLPLGFTLVAGLFAGLLQPLLVYNSFVFAPAVHASVLLPGSLPMWTALLAFLILGERLTRWRVLSLSLIFCGVGLVGGQSLLHALYGGDTWKGDLLMIMGSICWATYSVLVRKHRVEAVRATIALATFAFILYVPAYLALTAGDWKSSRLLDASWTEIAFQMIAQGWCTVVIAGIAFTKMISYFGPVRSTMITALVPGLSALGAVVLLGEPMGWNVVVGLILVTLGILFGVRVLSQRMVNGK